MEPGERISAGRLLRMPISRSVDRDVSLFAGYILQGSKPGQKIISGDIENQGHIGTLLGSN